MPKTGFVVRFEDKEEVGRYLEKRQKPATITIEDNCF